MKKMIRGTAAFLVLFGLGACYDYPSQVINNDNYHIVQPTPAVGWIGKVGDSLQVLFRFINDANNGTITSFDTVTGVPVALKIHYQANFRQVFCGDTLCNQVDKNEQSYYIVGMAPGEYSFKMVPTVNRNDTGSVFIRVAPSVLGPLSKNPANFGDTLVFTAPQYAKFTPNTGNSGSRVIWTANGNPTTIAGASTVYSADSLTIKVATTHGMMGFFSITNTLVRLPTLAAGASITSFSTDSLAKIP